jgi:hypothetical protein
MRENRLRASGVAIITMCRRRRGGKVYRLRASGMVITICRRRWCRVRRLQASGVV